MSKELEALMVLKQTIFYYTLGCLTTEEEKAFKVIENALKRLEELEKILNIIKLKRINTDEEITCSYNYDEYLLIAQKKGIYDEWWLLTKKEYELLKKHFGFFSRINAYSLKAEKDEKVLKALEIIKEKTTDVCNCLMILNGRNDNLSFEDYNKLFLTDLTQEEYELLKEVLM